MQPFKYFPSMHKVFYRLFLTIALIHLYGCMSDEQKMLRDTVEYLNEDCPRPLLFLANVDSIYYDVKENQVSIDAYLEDGMIDVYRVQLMYDEYFKPSLLDYFSAYDVSFFAAVERADANVAINFIQESTDECMTVVIKPEHIKEYYRKLPSEDEMSELMVKQFVMYESIKNGTGPSEGQVQQSILLDGKKVTLNWKMDESRYSYGDLLVAKKQIHDNMVEYFKTNNMRSHFQILKDANRYLVYHYQFDTPRKHFDIVFTSYDIAEILKSYK